MTQAPVAVIETRWWDHGNHSVKPMFEALAALNYSNPSVILYDMFSEEHSLERVLSSRCSDGTTRAIYLATHGDASSTYIGQNPNTAISRTKFKNILCKANAKGQLKGLFLGTCYTATNNTVSFLLSGGDSKLSWAAGYTESVEWIEGTAIDMVFFHHLTTEYVRNKSRKKGKKSDVEMAKIAATELMKLIPAAHSKYGFNIYYADGKKVESMLSGK